MQKLRNDNQQQVSEAKGRTPRRTTSDVECLIVVGSCLSKRRRKRKKHGNNTCKLQGEGKDAKKEAKEEVKDRRPKTYPHPPPAGNPEVGGWGYE